MTPARNYMANARLFGLVFPSPGSFFSISYFRYLNPFPVYFQKRCDKAQLLEVFKIILSNVLTFQDCFFPPQYSS